MTEILPPQVADHAYCLRVVLRVVVLLLVLTYLVRRFLPRYRLAWYAPLVLVGVILAVRTAGYLLGDDAGADAAATRR